MTFPKVSGSKGIQLYAPLNSPVSYSATQLFAKTIAELLEREHPKLVVADMAKNLRQNKVFIDWSQNADHKTTVGFYSLRAKRDRPFVSMPAKWSELEKGKSDQLYFEPAAALKRLKKIGDLFAPVLKLIQKLPPQFQEHQTQSPGSARALRSKGEGITVEEMSELCWLRPKLVAQINFTEWTNYGLLRHATFGRSAR